MVRPPLFHCFGRIKHWQINHETEDLTQSFRPFTFMVFQTKFFEYFPSFITAGLDTYFFLNLSVGQPSNNMDLSEIEIYLGTIKIFFLFRKKKSGRTLCLYIQFLFQDYCVWSTPSLNKSLVFFSRSFFCPLWRHRDQEYISRDIKNV